MAFYALLVGIEDYSELSLGSLPSAPADISLMRKALQTDLKIGGDNIRVPGQEEGFRVRREDLALSMASFQKLLGREDTLVFYFSGHGTGESLVFSDGPVLLQSIIDFLRGLDIKSALVILDCCYAGRFDAPDPPLMALEESLSAFAGRGIAVMASSAADRKSRLSGPGGASIFTLALTEAMGEKRLIRRNRISLRGLAEETAFHMSLWNREHPERAQGPVFRTAMGGTLFFPVGGGTERERLPVSFETPSCRVFSVKNMNASDVRRLCAFVIPGKRGEDRAGADTVSDKDLARMTREIAESLMKMPEEKLYPGDRRLKGRETGALWCYFAGDADDLRESLYFAVCVWAGNAEMKRRYYREDRYSRIAEGVLVQRNISYPMLKKMQEHAMDREKCLHEYGSLLAGIVNMAESFIRDLQETENGERSLEDLKKRYGSWIVRVRTMFIRLSDMERPPRELYAWTEGICGLAGWILDLSLYLDRESPPEDRECWLIRNALRHYYESMEDLAGLEGKAGIRQTGELPDGKGNGSAGARTERE